MSSSKHLLDQVKILCLHGDGIGPEITAATCRVLEAVNARYELGLVYTTHDIGFAALEQSGSTFPQHVLDAAKMADGVVVGPVSTNDYPLASDGGINPSEIGRAHV